MQSIGIEEIPESLHEWFRLNDQAEAHEELETPALADLYHRIVEAWESAPLLDRCRVDWKYLKHTWKTRNDEHA